MTTHEHDRFAELLPSYALGILEPSDLRALERHLEAGCDRCEAELRGLTGAVEAMADSIEPITPSETTRASTLAAVGADAPSQAAGPASPSVSPFWRLAAAAALVLLAWTGWSSFDLRRQMGDLTADNDALTVELERMREDLSATRTELARAQLANRIVSAPRTASVLLAGLEPAPDASARTYIDPSSRRAVFYAANLESLPADKTYQLWFIADGNPVSGGTFSIDDEGAATLLVEDVAAPESLEAWAVTVEPTGGVPQPTGAMVLLGSVA